MGGGGTPKIAEIEISENQVLMQILFYVIKNVVLIINLLYARS